MGWFEDLRGKVARAVSQNPVAASLRQPRRLAGRILSSSFVRPNIGFVPEVAGVIASELLPKGSTPKALLDAGLYLASGPLNVTANLAGSTPQGSDSYSNWQRLGYKSKEDMISRINRQKAVDEAISKRPPGVYIADDYGPPRPVQYPNGMILVGDYRIDRFNTPAAREVEARQPVREAGSPATRRPVEERRPPVSREVPVSPTPEPQSMNELAQMYARQRILGKQMAEGGELQRRLFEGGAVPGMSPESLMSWVEANPDLAYRLAEKRGLLPEPV